MSAEDYRLLTTYEIKKLGEQGCSAEDWSQIFVHEDFIAESVRGCRFEGTVRLGIFAGTIETESGITKKCGIFNSYIRNCDIASGVYISEVKSLAGYNIETNVAIENVGSMVIRGETTFGNGIPIEVLNEAGGRELPIFDRLSSQIAYLALMYRHDKDFTAAILEMIEEYCRTKRCTRGRIGTGARVRDSHILRDVWIGDYAVISGASLLEEGTIQCCRESPTFVGEGVIAKQFIILSGSSVDSSAIIHKSFIGEGVTMGKQFSAENSLFFANSEAFHGEACSLFAGPYSVTHHKSTLMIANLCSFFNAGSGTNQSNHMYKLGPVHQGIFERGSKTGSFAYLILPCVVGAYTVVMGKHYVNFDTSCFPFSYITEEKGKSELTPAMNIFTVGTRRDSEKWPKRDRRKNLAKLDLIHFNLLNPYIAGKIRNAIDILGELYENTPKSQDTVTYKGINIQRLLLKAARKYYEMAMKVYIGQELVSRLDTPGNDATMTTIRNLLYPGKIAGTGKWVEICGMFAPVATIENLIKKVKSGKIKSVPQLLETLYEIYNEYNLYAWKYCADLIEQQTGTGIDEVTPETLIQLIEDWKSNAIKLNNMILKDAEKEFDGSSRLSFGIDGDQAVRDLDFEAVRGTYSNNKFVRELQQEIRDIGEKADWLTGFLGKFCSPQVEAS
jgi:hypothetical protein